MAVASAGSELPAAPTYDLHLFVAGNTPRSQLARHNIERICQHYLAGRYVLTVVDVAQHPERAVAEELLGLPCLLKKAPGLVRRLVGDFSDQARVLHALGIQLP